MQAVSARLGRPESCRCAEAVQLPYDELEVIAWPR